VRTKPTASTALALVKARGPARTANTFLREALAGQLSPQTRRAYAADVAQFLNWLAGDGRNRNAAEWQDDPRLSELLRQVSRADIIAYRAALVAGNGANYAPLTVNRKLATLHSLFAEAVAQGLIESSPAAGVQGFKASANYQATPALLRSQVRVLLDAPDQDTAIGRRDHALLSLAVRTGLRVAELAGLRVGDLREEQGHIILEVRGKGSKVRRVKVAVEVARELRAWLDATGRRDKPEAPIFSPVRKGGKVGDASLSTWAIWRMVTRYLVPIIGKESAERFSPHALRATFITLALKGGAPLHKVQQAAGHSDPRTTMRYARLADDLDDNAADYVKINGAD
jgi:integrase/recombinase XerD